MEEITSLFKLENFKGDKTLWSFIIIISILSIFPVYSASSQLEFSIATGTTLGHIGKHIIFLALGLGVTWSVQRIKFKYIAKLCSLFLWLSIIGLVLVLVIGKQNTDGTASARWLAIPGTSYGVQPSAFANVFLPAHLCRVLANDIENKIKSNKFLFRLFFPIFLVVGLVARDNGSTAVIMIITSTIVIIYGQLNLRYILSFLGITTILGGAFLFILFNTNLIKENRADTWRSRIINHYNRLVGNPVPEDNNYQLDLATAAIVNGGLYGQGPGKSALKQDLSQSTSDFVFAIVVEEYGFIGAVALLLLYFIVFIRILLIASKFHNFYGSLLAISLGGVLFVQIFIHLGVSLRMTPVTGQPLPLISAGGTAMLATYILFGLILNVSASIQLYKDEGFTEGQAVKEINDIA